LPDTSIAIVFLPRQTVVVSGSAVSKRFDTTTASKENRLGYVKQSLLD
jgi:hypothetical protein